MVANSGGSNPGAAREWDNSSDEEAASKKLLDEKKNKKQKNKKSKTTTPKQKLINGIELEQENGISLDRVSEPENIKEIISKDEATTGSRFVNFSVT